MYYLSTDPSIFLPILFKLIIQKQMLRMSQTSFTFLNATGTPDLSPLAAKQMRAHITRTNFEKRRERILRDAEPVAAETRPKRHTADQPVSKRVSRIIVTDADLVAALPITSQLAHRFRYAQFRAYNFSSPDDAIAELV
jgi:hypothetical protein